jgi:hypothetical protein
VVNVINLSTLLRKEKSQYLEIIWLVKLSSPEKLRRSPFVLSEKKVEDFEWVVAVKKTAEMPGLGSQLTRLDAIAGANSQGEKGLRIDRCSVRDFWQLDMT